MPSPETYNLISELEIDPNKPLIISDADEVVFELFSHLFEYYESLGYVFKGNNIIGFEMMNHMYHVDSGKLIELDVFDQIITDFFKIHAEDMPFVENAYENLMALGEYCQIIVLTNAPHSYRKKRIKTFNEKGLHFPIITNANNKMPAIKMMTQNHKAPIFFIDDSPEHHNSVLEELSHVHCIHFIGCKKYAKLVAKVDNAHFSSTSWHDVKTYIDGILLK